jgi:acyl-CoA synthetase (AMP-forming)/AMP-acid ligase II/acyl carrier protein
MLAQMTIYRAVMNWVDIAPERTAILAPGGVALGYLRLKCFVDDLVCSMAASGVGRQDRVAVVLPNGPELAIALIASASAGVCAPLNPGYCEAEFEFYFSDLKPKLLIAMSGIDSPALAVAHRHGVPILTCSESGNRAGEDGKSVAASSSPAQLAAPDDLALLLYTSGTTAKPKRVPLTHANLLISAQNIGTSLALQPADRCLNMMPLFHIHGLVGAMLSSLAAGSSIAIPPRFDGSGFFDWLDELQPTWYTAVPTIHQAILQDAKNHRATIARSKLRLIRSSSAPLPLRLIAELEGVFQAPLIEAYGMTEAAHQIASNPLPPRQRKPGSVGLGTGVEIAIMDEAGTFRKRGETGEIVVRGPNITRGYDDNPGANEQAFSRGWFRTGDQGYLDADGYLFITGRLKELINRGGEKIAPREIDEVLLSHPEVLQAAAFAVAHASLGEDVAAAVVVRDKRRASEFLLRQYLFEKLAPFKIPSRIFVVDELPKGATGKLQRIGLLAKIAKDFSAGSAAPETGLEATIAEIYEEVLGVKDVGGQDNFFELGGDSLRATQVISRIRSIFHIDLPIATIFWRATVIDLAHEISRALG